MILNAEELNRVKKANERGFHGCFRNRGFNSFLMSRKETKENGCDDSLCNKLFPSRIITQETGFNICPCDVLSIEEIENRVNEILEENK